MWYHFLNKKRKKKVLIHMPRQKKETMQQKRERAARVVAVLKGHYPATCSLEAQKDYELLFATRLSAQCTDARVNIVTKDLYAKYPTLESFAQADMEELCAVIKPCGLFRTKARDIKAAAQTILERFGGKVPDNMDDLLSIPGVGRKTANLVLGDMFGKPGIVADTHCIRINGRLGFSDSKDPYKVEMTLDGIIEKTEQADYCHRLVHFGRDICTARSPKCEICPLCEYCNTYQNDV